MIIKQLVIIFSIICMSSNKASANSWTFLKQTDIIDIVWPSASPHIEDALTVANFAAFCTKLDQLAKTYGLGGVHCHQETLAPESSLQSFYANTPQARASTLKGLLADPRTKAIWAGRGGYGAAELLHILESENFNLPPNQIKPIIGFSDITTLHLWALKHKWPCLHAPMAQFNQNIAAHTKVLANAETSLDQLMHILKGDITKVQYSLKLINPEVLTKSMVDKDIVTQIVGGNFSILQRNLATSTQLNTKNNILFLEDDGEPFYLMSSIFAHLMRAGTFQDIKAFFFGDFPVEAGSSTEEILQYFNNYLQAHGLNIPILYSPDFGHGAVNYVLPLGTKTILRYNQNGTATLNISVNEAYES